MTTNGTDTRDVTELTAAAAAAAPVLDARGRAFRARLLRAVAEAIEAHRDDIVTVADRETSIGATRLRGEHARTAYQARLFADVLDEGSYLEATIDHPTDTPMGPGPDLRRLLVPLGPVAVFGASNFPLAFSVPGGDTVSALAAGCPVVVKAHPSHPRTSRLTFDLLAGAARDVGAPEGTLGIVFGQRAGADLVADPRIRAVAFTGSLRGARALMDVIATRAEPIPFYGELSSLNPVVVTAGAAGRRGREIAEGLVASFTTSAGQLCTKPGLVLVPAGPDGDRLVAHAADLVGGAAPGTALNDGISTAYGTIGERLATSPGVSVLAEGVPVLAEGGPAEPERVVRPRLLSLPASELRPEVTEECFGPLAVIARYRDDDELRAAIDRLPASLTGTLHAEPEERDHVVELTDLLSARAGRVVFDGFPTGVLVSWAQTHGGPWPATTSPHTSVGPTAIRRFLRPVTWQNAPAYALPPELRDGAVDIPRRVDGRWQPPGQ
ncbi:NADP-dependent aldehyde dehydrogenase [Amycolatopsis arida]|uniref:NADP-dependent aldehyde dehydrogenase n=1 Tax=Amycolatopsis arida TaxID=587909 RepID=A0A1I5MB75_9PSEU|nr:aldehyde dehydrogenase (NADP(+)) [Amycolatopsis arida]TDX94034.1 NADP-dependent aldehyde dehydrogenase [Amycolatopsis arida]SFP06759.1 NADP-dependent aldehyde dehydrogenase [Amycolatopsis arida]